MQTTNSTHLHYKKTGPRLFFVEGSSSVEPVKPQPYPSLQKKKKTLPGVDLFLQSTVKMLLQSIHDVHTPDAFL